MKIVISRVNPTSAYTKYTDKRIENITKINKETPKISTLTKKSCAILIFLRYSY